MLLYFYHLSWTLFILLSLPLLISGKGRRFRERLRVRVPPGVRGTETLWVHALSVGEVISAIPLLRALKERFPRKEILFTVTTAQGMEIAKASSLEGVTHILPMPLDFWWSFGKIIRSFRPSLFILVETDLWPGLIFTLKKMGIKTILVNGRISPRTYRSYKRFRALVRPLLNALDRYLVQTDLDRRRLLDIGMQAEKVKTAGNMKFDRNRPPMGNKEARGWSEILGLNPGERVWVAGSTHPGEETIILNVFKALRDSYPELRLIIAPRRIERGHEVCRLGREMGFKTFLRTEISQERGPYDILVLDTLGELDRIYGLGIIGFVGGSLVPIGGHNPLEPAGFGLPVLFGPHTHNFELMSQSLLDAGGGWRVRDEEDLRGAMMELLARPEKTETMGRKAREFVETHQGALSRIVNHIEKSLSPG